MRQTPTIYTADNRTSATAPANGSLFTIDELQEIVSGYTNIIALRDGAVMVTNEMGQLYQLPINTQATSVARSIGAISDSEFISGDVLICPSTFIRQ